MPDRKRLAAPFALAIAWALGSVRHESNDGLRDILSGARSEEPLATNAGKERRQ